MPKNGKNLLYTRLFVPVQDKEPSLLVCCSMLDAAKLGTKPGASGRQVLETLNDLVIFHVLPETSAFQKWNLLCFAFPCSSMIISPIRKPWQTFSSQVRESWQMDQDQCTLGPIKGRPPGKLSLIHCCKQELIYCRQRDNATMQQEAKNFSMLLCKNLLETSGPRLRTRSKNWTSRLLPAWLNLWRDSHQAQTIKRPLTSYMRYTDVITKPFYQSKD